MSICRKQRTCVIFLVRPHPGVASCVPLPNVAAPEGHECGQRLLPAWCLGAADWKQSHTSKDLNRKANEPKMVDDFTKMNPNTSKHLETKLFFLRLHAKRLGYILHGKQHSSSSAPEKKQQKSQRPKRRRPICLWVRVKALIRWTTRNCWDILNSNSWMRRCTRLDLHYASKL